MLGLPCTWPVMHIRVWFVALSFSLIRFVYIGTPLVYFIFLTSQVCIWTNDCCLVAMWCCRMVEFHLCGHGWLSVCGIVALWSCSHVCVCVHMLRWLSDCGFVAWWSCNFVKRTSHDVCMSAENVALKPCAPISLFFWASCMLSVPCVKMHYDH